MLPFIVTIIAVAVCYLFFPEYVVADPLTPLWWIALTLVLCARTLFTAADYSLFRLKTISQSGQTLGAAMSILFTVPLFMATMRLSLIAVLIMGPVAGYLGGWLCGALRKFIVVENMPDDAAEIVKSIRVYMMLSRDGWIPAVLVAVLALIAVWNV